MCGMCGMCGMVYMVCMMIVKLNDLLLSKILMICSSTECHSPYMHVHV